MKGSIRIGVGFLIVFGSIGTIDLDPGADILFQTAIAVIGLGIMLNGVLASQKQNIG